MKKTIILSCILLAGCSANKLTVPQEQSTLQYSRSTEQKLPVTGDNTGIYYTDDYGSLYYLDKNFNSHFLHSLSYLDDMPLDQATEQTTFKKYEDDLYGDCKKVGDRIWFLSMRTTIEKDVQYFFNSVDLKGENRKEHLKLDYYPSDFAFFHKKLYISEDNMDGTVSWHAYDKNFKETEIPSDKELDFNTVFITNNTIYSNTSALNLESGKVYSYPENHLFVYANDNYYATRTFDKSADETADFNTVTHTFQLYKSDTNELVFETKNESIDYFDDNYIYTTDISSPNVTYRVYDYDKNLIHEIKPSDSIPTEPFTPIFIVQHDFSTISAVVDDHIITSSIQSNTAKGVVCSIEDGSCKVLEN